VFFQVMRDKLVALAARYSIPAIYEWPEFTVSGGLLGGARVAVSRLT
jgi:hypothetical protein